MSSYVPENPAFFFFTWIVSNRSHFQYISSLSFPHKDASGGVKLSDGEEKCNQYLLMSGAVEVLQEKL